MAGKLGYSWVAANYWSCHARARGGIGRRARLRALCPQGRAGSTPVGPTWSRAEGQESRANPLQSAFRSCNFWLLTLDPPTLDFIDTGTRNQWFRVPFYLATPSVANGLRSKYLYNSNECRSVDANFRVAEFARIQSSSGVLRLQVLISAANDGI
jgi:hypothetical protein